MGRDQRNSRVSRYSAAPRSRSDRLGRGPSGAVKVVIAGEPSPGSDAALARAFADLLQRKHPGTRWDVHGVKPRIAPKTTARQASGSCARRVGDHGDTGIVAA
jgi:hypothetical protein